VLRSNAAAAVRARHPLGCASNHGGDAIDADAGVSAVVGGSDRPPGGDEPVAFAHRFRVIARMSPMRFVKEVRLDAARRLLVSEGARASDVAIRVGYESPAHFARDFKRRFGAPPTRYARQLR